MARRPRDARRRTPRPPARAGAAKKPRTTKAPASAAPAPQPSAQPERPFRLGAVPGATVGGWIDTWNQRMPRNPLELVPVAVAGQREAIADVDIALVRLPIDRDRLHVIALYDETPVVVMSVDSDLTAGDELDSGDLDGQVLLTPADDVLAFTAPGMITPAFDPPETTKDAVATAAAGVGVLVVPTSLARLHHRKDVTYRPLADGPISTVALAWEAERTTPLVETFVGIVRGRTANSSR